MASNSKKASVTITVQPPKAKAPKNLLANAEIHFHTGLMAGLRITGIALWRAYPKGRDPFVSVTFPTRETENGNGEIVYFDYLRGNVDRLRNLKAQIVQTYEEFLRDRPATPATDPAPPDQEPAELGAEWAQAAEEQDVPF
jgi:hypothetical protein